MRSRIKQAYQQAPWRVQTQRMGVILLGVVAVSLVFGTYLFISAQSAAAGLLILDYDDRKQILLREISDLEARLAMVTSTSVMNERAREMGFEPLQAQNIIYIPMPEYPGRTTPELAPALPTQPDVSAVILPEYRESLWEWFFQDFTQIPHPGAIE